MGVSTNSPNYVRDLLFATCLWYLKENIWWFKVNIYTHVQPAFLRRFRLPGFVHTWRICVVQSNWSLHIWYTENESYRPSVIIGSVQGLISLFMTNLWVDSKMKCNGCQPIWTLYLWSNLKDLIKSSGWILGPFAESDTHSTWRLIQFEVALLMYDCWMLTLVSLL